MMDELAYSQRVNVHIGQVLSINDGGQAQTATVISHDFYPRADIPVMQPYGFNSMPPGDGATSVMLSVGGDAAQFILLALCCPSVRFGNLLNGESVQYGADGSRVHIRQGGTIEAIAGTEILAQVGDTSVTISQTEVTINAASQVEVIVGGVSFTVSASGVTIVGKLTCQDIVSIGSITATGAITPDV